MTTDAAGSYRIEGLTTGNYGLLFSDPTSALAPYFAPDAGVQSGGAPTIVNASLEPAAVSVAMCADATGRQPQAAVSLPTVILVLATLFF